MITLLSRLWLKAFRKIATVIDVFITWYVLLKWAVKCDYWSIITQFDIPSEAGILRNLCRHLTLIMLLETIGVCSYIQLLTTLCMFFMIVTCYVIYVKCSCFVAWSCIQTIHHCHWHCATKTWLCTAIRSCSCCLFFYATPGKADYILLRNQNVCTYLPTVTCRFPATLFTVRVPWIRQASFGRSGLSSLHKSQQASAVMSGSFTQYSPLRLLAWGLTFLNRHSKNLWIMPDEF